MPASVNLKALGLVTSPNQLETPPGTLSEAKNIVIRDNDVISQRRGFGVYGESFGTSSDRAKQLFTYQNRILRYFNTTLEFDTGVTNTSNVELFDAFSGSFSEAKTDLKIKSIESNGNLYFTTANGIQKISAASADDFTTDSGFITKAGGIKAVDLTAEVTYDLGNQTGFLPSDSAVAYRVLWLYNDLNKNLIPGTPSQRAEVFNSLLNSLLQDFNRLLGALDDLNQTGSLINDGDYVSTLRLPINASATDLYNDLLLLSSKLDDDILFADQVASAPLQISTTDITDGSLTVNFSSGSPFSCFNIADNIDLSGFTFTDSNGSINSSATNGVNGPQVIASIFPIFTTSGDLTQGVEQVTQVVTVADSGGNLGGTFFNINSANDVKQYYVWFNVSGTGLDPSLSGKTGIRVNLVTNDADTVVASKINAAINSFASTDFTSTVLTDTVTITNNDDGPALSADAGTTGFTVTTTTPGTAGNIITSVADTSGVIIGSHITGTGIPTDSYVLSTTINTITINNNVTSSSTETLNFDAGIKMNTTLEGTVTTSNATITDYTFEAITEPTLPSSPPTNAQLVGLQTYLSAIIVALQNKNSFIIPTNLKNTYIDVLDITNSANVQLQITIPSNVTDNDFFQIYRSDIAQATGTTILADLTPNDELKLVYEAFPTADELSARSISVLDITPDIFRGANLYTNEASGVGLAQAYDLPPFALDINRYKNVTFYANTKTLQRRLISLIGVINMINDYGNGLNTHTFTSSDVNTTDDIITISNHGFTNTQSIEFHNADPSDLPGGLVASQTYYVLNATTNTFQVSEVKGGSPVDLTSGGSGTHTVFNELPEIVITNGTTTNVYKFIVGLQESTEIQTEAGSTLNDSGTASYFYINSANDTKEYYVWYQIDASTDPLIAGKIGIPVVADSGDTADQIATKTENTLAQFIADFTTSVVNDTVTVTNTKSGATTAATSETSGFTISVTVAGIGEDATLKHILLSDLTSVGQSVDETARSLVRIINKNDSEIVNAFYLSTAGGVPGQIFLEARNLSDQPFYLLGNNQNTGQSFSPEISPENFIIGNTVADPTVIESSSPHGFVNGDQVVIINSNSTPSIDGLYDITFIDSTHFSIPVNVTSAGTTGSFRLASDSLFSDNEKKPNRIYYSVFQQPDAVPLVNFFDVGSQDKEILRIMPLRDSLFVFKEDGLFRVSGEVAPFVTALFDSSCIVVAPDSVAVSNNMIFAWTKRGIVVVTEGGIDNITDKTINNIVKPLSSSTFPSFSSKTWAIGYESDNSYTVFTLVDPTDTTPQIGYRYDQITNTWTTIDKDYTCAVIHELDDKMYTGAGDTNVIEQERKSFTRLDFADRELPLVLSPGQYFQTLMTFLVNIDDLDAGDVLVQTQYLTIYQFNQTLLKLDYDPATTGDYFDDLEAQPGDNLRTDIIALANKLDSDPGISFADYFDSIDTKSGSISNISITNPTIITTSSPHELQNNRIVTISGSNSDPLINDTYPVTVIDANNFSIPVNVTQTAGNSGSFATIDGDFRDIQACYNFMIQHLNLDSGVTFSNYQESEGTTEQESIITLVNTIKKQLTVNLALPYVEGPMSVFKAIDTSVTYSQITFDDPLSLKQIVEASMMFANKAFTSASLNFASDIIPEFSKIPFFGDGNGLFGYSGNMIGFGSGFFGGLSHGSPFRTIIPLANQRCRYIIPQFQHGIAREIYQIYGLTLFGATGQSTRTTR